MIFRTDGIAGTAVARSGASLQFRAEGSRRRMLHTMPGTVKAAQRRSAGRDSDGAAAHGGMGDAAVSIAYHAPARVRPGEDPR